MRRTNRRHAAHNLEVGTDGIIGVTKNAITARVLPGSLRLLSQNMYHALQSTIVLANMAFVVHEVNVQAETGSVGSPRSFLGSEGLLAGYPGQADMAPSRLYRAPRLPGNPRPPGNPNKSVFPVDGWVFCRRKHALILHGSRAPETKF